nr:isoleucine--trna ligase [Quercus suber]
MVHLFSSHTLRATITTRKAVFTAITNWSETLTLPKSKFPARATRQALDTYRRRCADDLYEWQRESRKNAADFVLHDGPPYANGAVHLGHALNKILKDLILRWELAKGKRISYRPGWDCHGLPIELKALQRVKTNESQVVALVDEPKQEAVAALDNDLRPVEIRRVAAQLASETVEKQKESFKSWGIVGEWDNPYRTMNQDFETRQLGVFREMVSKGLISRHHRPVYWSPSSRTALAEAELEYDDAHKCIAAFVKLPFVRLPKTLRNNPRLKASDVSALIWTTTPWTLPANKAVAIHEDIEYAIIELEDPSRNPALQGQMLVAKNRIQHVLSHVQPGVTVTLVVDSVYGAQLCDGSATCYNLFQGKESPLISADFVTSMSGTGVVHMAPGHGMEDYQVCQQKGIGPALAPVDEAGNYTDEVFPIDTRDSQLVGLDAQTEGTARVLNILSSPELHVSSAIHGGNSLLLASHSFTHKNPIDWRTKQPVIVRATAQWFADVSAITKPSLAALENVVFLPESGKTRLGAFLSGRSQWCISRQRAWGVPIPALYHVDTGEVCISDDSISHIIRILEQRGTDAWFADSPDDPAWQHHSLQPGKWVRGTDTMDVWFDSGTSWTSLQQRHDRPLSDVYLEGTDQHRGWFQSSLLTAIATQDPKKPPVAPYAKLITHGFILDAEGKKMSKSIGNVIDPDEVVAGTLLPPLKQKKTKKPKDQDKKSAAIAAVPQYDSLGPDVLRLWVASSDYTRDVSVAVPVLQEVQQALQKYRVTFKFLLGVLSDFPLPLEQELNSFERSQEHLTFADQMILDRLSRTTSAVRNAYEDYQFHKAVKEINILIYNDLSSFYFEICKDRIYTGSAAVRSHTQGVLYIVLKTLLNLLGPIVPHLVEEVWEYMPSQLRNTATGEDDMALHPLRQPWAVHGLTPDHHVGEMPALPNERSRLDSSILAFQTLNSAVKIAQEDARRAGHLRSGLACEVVIYRRRADAEDQVISQVWDSFIDELQELLVVSGVDIVKHDNSPEDFTQSMQALRQSSESLDSKDAAWRFTQFVDLDHVSKKSETIWIEVRPPSAEKCVRCWRFTAEEKEVPCPRCRDVLQEQGFHDTVS